VDAALGGAVIFSQKLMEGKQNMFEDVDSITIDPHKGLVVPLQLSLFLVNKR
jgi:glutamate/tyrosine decarboxylase-like PLP-dependent enzyme